MKGSCSDNPFDLPLPCCVSKNIHPIFCPYGTRRWMEKYSHCLAPEEQNIFRACLNSIEYFFYPDFCPQMTQIFTVFSLYLICVYLRNPKDYLNLREYY
jgi:hypothetical protein